MSAYFEKLDYCSTPIGALSLRHRRDLRLGTDGWEIMLGQDYLMASRFTASEVALGRPGRRFDAILANIDHAPDHLLDDRSSGFYRVEGLRALGRHLKPAGIFGLWANKMTDQRFFDRLGAAFAEAWVVEPVTFDNPPTGRPFTQTVYLARAADG